QDPFEVTTTNAQNPADAGPGVQPGAQGPESAIVRGHGATGEADRCPEGVGRVGRARVTRSPGPLAPAPTAGSSEPTPWPVLRLITSSSLVGCSTGRSAGLAPLRMRST